MIDDKYKDELIKKIHYHFYENRESYFNIFATMFKNYQVYYVGVPFIRYTVGYNKRFLQLGNKYSINDWIKLYRFLELECDIEMLEKLLFKLI